MARYEEERYGGQRGSTRRGGYSERVRDDDDFEQQERERYRSSEYGREYGERERTRGANEGSWRGREREYGRSLGGREYEAYDDVSRQRSQTDYQSNVGKGPKNWQRSDERIREEVSEALARHPEIDPSDVEVRVQSCEVTLTGSVSDRRAKRLAEDVAESIFGVKDVHNQIRVDTSSRFGERDVTSTPDREGRISSEAAEKESRRTGAGTTAGTTNR